MRNLKRALSLAMASVMLLGMMVVGTSAASYSDVDAQDHLEAIEVMQMLGVMSGVDEENFNPDATVSRNEMAVIMCHLMDLKPSGVSPFTDVPEWAQPYVAACYANGVTAGYDATTYGGSDPVTTTQAALMVMKPLGYFGYTGEFGESWNLAVIKQGTEIDLFDEVNAGVNDAMTRNELAQMVLNALECTVTIVREQGGVHVDANGATVVVNPTYEYSSAENKSGFHYAGADQFGNIDGTQQLVEKLYGKDVQKQTGAQTDDFGRPATKWTYGTASVVAPNAPDQVYTAAVKGSQIFWTWAASAPTPSPT